MSNKDYERHSTDGTWHEWSTDVSDSRPSAAPQRLFVRVDNTITITECLVTSRNAGARALVGGEFVQLMLTGEQAAWLRDTLTKALVARGDEGPKR